MSDGKITFSTKIENSQVDKDLKDIQKKIQKSEETITKADNAKLPLTKQAEELGVALDAAKAKVQALRSEQKSISVAMQPGATPTAYIDAASRKSGVDAELKVQEKEVAKLQGKWDSVNNRIDSYDVKIKKATADIAANKAKAGQLQAQLSKGGVAMSAAFAKASKSVQHFGKRLMGIASSALVFSLIYRGLHQVVQYMGKVLNTNEQYRAQMAQLKGALLTAFQPIYEFVLPGVLAVLKVLTAIVSVIANVFSALSGKTIKQSADSAKAINKETKAVNELGSAAKKASREIAGFDQINMLGSESAGDGVGGIAGGAGSGAIDPDFSAFDTSEYKAKIDELTVYLSGALLAIGAILAFSGVSIPLGISLMAAGAIGLVAVVKENWGAMSEPLKEALTNVGLILGGAMLAVGAVLAFSGVSIAKGIVLMALGAAALAGTAALNWDSLVNALQGPTGKLVALLSGVTLVLGAILAFSGVALPLGIALMAVGAAGLATVTALNWDSISTALQGPIGKVFAIASGALLVLGIILACTGVALPLGIALIAAGAAGLVTVTALNWGAIVEKCRGVWDSIKGWWNSDVAPVFTIGWWQDKFNSIGEGLKSAIKSGINAAIGLINSFTGWVSSALSFSIPPISIGDHQIFDGFSASINIPQIPYLARGAVLPPNKPFMAVVGDQKHGTNIEAPLDTIKQAVAEVASPAQVLELLAQIIGLLAQIRDGNGEIDMRKLSRLITKYQRELARAGGV